MQKKWWVIVNVFVLVILVLILIGTIWDFSFKKSEVLPKECIGINQNSNFVYDACYDAYSKNILLLQPIDTKIVAFISKIALLFF